MKNCRVCKRKATLKMDGSCKDMRKCYLAFREADIKGRKGIAMLKWILCKLLGHDWKGIEVKTIPLHDGIFKTSSLMECFRCRRLRETSKVWPAPNA